MPALISNRQRKIPLDIRRTRKDSLSLLRLYGLTATELGVSFAGARLVRKLNREFRGKDRPTDVLSFPANDPAAPASSAPGGTPLLGDIIICPEVAMANAAEYDASLDSEIRRLLVHGFLHLLGYDHETGHKDAARMRRKEKECLRALEAMD
ncbi:MAG: rRNA maturation RNase YbeY [Nitrospiraceae bacterium]|nr:rRNA maturation RNase YbeY [Nitrospiraceae bacterium]